MTVLPSWPERIRAAGSGGGTPASGDNGLAVRLSARRHEERISFVATREEAEKMAEFAGQRPLSHIGIDTEFRYDRPPLLIDRKTSTSDPSSIHPLLLSLSMVEPLDNDEMRVYRFVVDLAQPEVHDGAEGNPPHAGLLLRALPQSRTVLSLAVWGFPLLRPSGTRSSPRKPSTWGNTGHARTPEGQGRSRGPSARRKRSHRTSRPSAIRSSSTCQRYGVSHDLGAQKERLQQSFLDHVDGTPLHRGASSVRCRRRHRGRHALSPQVLQRREGGILQHLITVEMPWVVTNAAMEWRGVRIDEDRRDQYQGEHPGTERADDPASLRHSMVSSNVDSHPQLKEFFGVAGVIDVFRAARRVLFDRKALEEERDIAPGHPRHPQGSTRRRDPRRRNHEARIHRKRREDAPRPRPVGRRHRAADLRSAEPSRAGSGHPPAGHPAGRIRDRRGGLEPGRSGRCRGGLPRRCALSRCSTPVTCTRRWRSDSSTTN